MPYAEDNPVKIPMMPKGVEHSRAPASPGGGACVKIPMMPKGVEHDGEHDDTNATGSEDSNDAERR